MSARLRPRFRLRVGIDADAVMDEFRARRDCGDLPCQVQLYEHQVEFSVRERDRHFWSPFLNLVIESTSDETVLYGKYGPNVNVWSMFLAAYAALFIGAAVGFFLGTSQMQLDQPLTGFWLTLGCTVGAVVVYVVGRIGRSLAHPQMMMFHGCVERVFGEHIIDIEDEEALVERSAQGVR